MLHARMPLLPDRRQKTLKIFTREEGGFHHCQVDDATIGIHTMWDWIADVLDAGG